MKKIIGSNRDWRDNLRELLDGPIRAAGVMPTAQKIGVSDPSLHRWMGGHNSLGREKLEQLAALFGYSVSTTISKSTTPH